MTSWKFHLHFPWFNRFNVVHLFQICSILFKQNSAELETSGNSKICSWMSLTLLYLLVMRPAQHHPNISQNQSQHIAARMGSECSREQLGAFWLEIVCDKLWTAEYGASYQGFIRTLTRRDQHELGVGIVLPLWPVSIAWLSWSVRHNTSQYHSPKSAQQEDMIGRHSLGRHCFQTLLEHVATFMEHSLNHCRTTHSAKRLRCSPCTEPGQHWWEHWWEMYGYDMDMVGVSYLLASVVWRILGHNALTKIIHVASAWKMKVWI